MMKTILLIFVFFYVIDTTTTAKHCGILPGFIVQVQNLIQDSNILVHCKSKDDDIGDHYLSFNDEFNWKFCENFGQTTLFFCHFYWGSMEQVFNVFDDDMYFMCIGEHDQSYYSCNWSAMADGFYLYDFNSTTWMKQYDWKS